MQKNLLLQLCFCLLLLLKEAQTANATGVVARRASGRGSDVLLGELHCFHLFIPRQLQAGKRMVGKGLVELGLEGRVRSGVVGLSPNRVVSGRASGPARRGVAVGSSSLIGRPERAVVKRRLDLGHK